MAPSSRTDLDSVASSPRTFLPYKDADDSDIPLLNPALDSASDVENGEVFQPRQSSNTWRNYLMTLRQRLTRSPRVNNSADHAHNSDRPTYSKKKVWLRRLLIWIPIGILMLFGVVHIIQIFMGIGSARWEYKDDDFLPDYGRPNRFGAGLATYPTDFTRDVTPIPCHSHNDYWRRVPLFQAIHYGCSSVEADVWLFDEELFVGHNAASLTKERTFRSLYVNPIADILDRQNPANEFGNTTSHGVFDTDPEQTLVLLVDFKNSGKDILPYVFEQLEPLRSKGHLTFWDGKERHSRAVTVVATGNAPFDLVTANETYRDIFFDAPLASFYEKPNEHTKTRTPARGQGGNGVDENSSFDESNSFYASVSFWKAIGIVWLGRLSQHQTDLVRGQIQGAQKRGLKVRYWDTPTWPVGLRNHVWDILMQEGVDYLNVDDLRGAAMRDWSRFD